MKKERVNVNVLLHPAQVKIIKLIKNKKINLATETLRSIGLKIDLPESPQQVKHHLQRLVTLGILNIVNGNYKYNK